MGIIETIAGLAVVVLLCVNVHTTRKAALDQKKSRERDRERLRYSDEMCGEYCADTDYMLLSGGAAKRLDRPELLPSYYSELLKDQSSAAKAKVAFVQDVMQSPGQEGVKDLLLDFPDGISRWFAVKLKVLLNERGALSYAFWKASPIHVPQIEQERQVENAKRDSLTGVYNPTISSQLISENLQLRRKDDGGALFCVDICKFNEINESCGYHAGDKVLIKVAGALRQAFRKEDVIGRLGKDRFVVFMRSASSRELIRQKCKKLFGAAGEMVISDRTGMVGFRIGVALTGKEDGYEELLSRAEKAMLSCGEDEFAIVDNTGEVFRTE